MAAPPLFDAAHRDEPDEVREADGEAARLRVEPQTGVERETDRDAAQALVAARALGEVLVVGEPEDPEAPEEIDAVDRSRAAVDRDPVLGVELRGVVAVPDLDDVRVEVVRGGPSIEVEVEDPIGEEIGEVADVEALEERGVAEDAADEAVEPEHVPPREREPLRRVRDDLRVGVVAPERRERGVDARRDEVPARREDRLVARVVHDRGAQGREHARPADEHEVNRLDVEPAVVARGERDLRVDLLEPVVEEDLRRDPEVVPEADAGAEALVLQDRVVLLGLRRDQHVPEAEEVARAVVEELGLGDPVRASELRVREPRPQRELAVGDGERAAERDPRAGEVRLGDRRAAVGGERLGRRRSGRRRRRGRATRR